MRIFDSPNDRLHNPEYEILDGVVTRYFEEPRRAAIIREALAHAELPNPEAPPPLPAGLLVAVHQAEYLAYLEGAYAAWRAAGLPPAAVLPSVLPPLGASGDSPHPTARAGRFCYDLSAPITATTWEAACGAAAAAAAGANALRSGEALAYALCRPPGHHAGPGWAGGYCFLNNAALAAHMLAADEAGQAWAMRAPSVAILDIDYHHGNGTQAIFYQRSDVLTVSLHADPTREYPFFSGFAHERGEAGGEGYNLNICLPAALDDRGYLQALDQVLGTIAAYGPRYLVVSAGFDTFGGDPLGDLALSSAAYPAIGAAIGQLGLPTLVVQEGGYAVEALGTNVVGLLEGLATS